MGLFGKIVSEDSLTVEERRAFDLHLGECRRCRDLAALTSRLPLFANAKDDSEHEEAVITVLEKLRRSRQADGRRKRGWTAFAIAASMAALTFIGMSVFRDSAHDPATVSPSFQCRPSLPVEPSPGVFVTYCDNDRPDTTVKNGEVSIFMQNGMVGLFVDPKRPLKQKVAVKTSLGEIRVKGTLFTVHIDNGNAEVDVFRGVVEVIPKEKKNPVFQVTAGYGAELTTQKTFRLKTSAGETLLNVLPIDKTAEHSEEILTNDKGSVALVASAEVKDAGENTAAIDKAEQTEQAESHGRRGMNSSVKPAAASMETLIQEARTCLLTHDWECAAARYLDVLKGYSQYPESAAVLISLAKVELRHLNQPKNALAHYREYKEQAPNGPLVDEAFIGMADAYRLLGQEQQEVETLQRFIEKFPTSSLSGKARKRLKQIDGSASL
jgi:TolA-binding protein